MTKQREVEIRFQLTPAQREDIMSELAKKGWEPQEVTQHDTYFCHRSFLEVGKEEDCPYVVRIRETNHGAKLAYKSFTGDGSWLEYETTIGNADQTVHILEGIDLKAYLSINKQRLVGTLKKMELNIDRIEGLGDFMELEVLTEQAEVGRELLVAFAKELGIAEDCIMTQGYVQLMEAHLKQQG